MVWLCIVQSTLLDFVSIRLPCHPVTNLYRVTVGLKTFWSILPAHPAFPGLHYQCCRIYLCTVNSPFIVLIITHCQLKFLPHGKWMCCPQTTNFQHQCVFPGLPPDMAQFIDPPISCQDTWHEELMLHVCYGPLVTPHCTGEPTIVHFISHQASSHIHCILTL